MNLHIFGLSKTVSSRNSILGASLFAMVLTSLTTIVSAQQLEEIIVTAQRREQRLQEVPISISTVSSAEIIRQGFREMEDLESFVPSVEIEANLHDTSITIRGMGNDVANMSVEQSAPMFVDGVTFGRGSMIDIAFLDVERIEVLAGPQPISFGQNAVAGAFSITSKKPTPEWEGDITAEYGNFARFSVEGGVGGPINDNWGIRLAGQWDQTKGHLIDIFSGESFPHRREAVGRIITTWTPTDNFQALFKVDYMNRKSEGDPNASCITTGIDDLKYDETAILFRGEVPEWDATHARQRQFPNCADGHNRMGFKEGQEFRERPVQGINGADGRNGLFDISGLALPFQERVGIPTVTLEAREPLKVWNFLINLNYEFDNGISIESNSAMIDYHRETYEDNEIDPFVTDSSSRVEQFDMWSQEIRVRSPSGGQIEWEVGGYYQEEALDLNPVLTFRSNLRESIRLFSPWQDPKWASVFGTFTFNFFDDRMSLDVGGRYTDVKKTGAITSQQGAYIFDIDPDGPLDPDPTVGEMQSTRHRAGPGPVGDDTTTLRFSSGSDVPVRSNSGNAAGTNEYIIDCGDPAQNVRVETQLRAAPSGETTLSNISPCGTYGAGFYTSTFDNRYTPDAWDTRAPIDIVMLRGFSSRPGPFLDTFKSNSIDPQVVLRYRPTDNISTYAKWVKAFKAGGFDTSDRGMPQGGIGTSLGQSEFSFDDENATNYEIGARGTVLDNQVRFGVTLFWQEIKDLQVETPIPSLADLLAGGESSGRGQVNAGKQRTRGVDFDATWLVNENLVLNLAGVVQEGEILDFIGGCTDAELIVIDEPGGCFSESESAAFLGLNVGDPGADVLEELFDRTGFRAPRTPDWKILVGLDYEYPLPWFDNIKYQFNAKTTFSDGYTEDTLGFSEDFKWDNHVNINLNAGFASIDNFWQLNFWVRNLLDTREKYFPEFDVDPSGMQGGAISSGDYTTYGVQLGYQF
jgi:outer membrane receptor protein involved in Fe transport